MIADRWGVTDDEITLPFPCDDWVPHPTFAVWRGVSVDTSAHDLWPWVGQVRFAPYAYDWLDNLGRPSPPTLLDVAPPSVGEPFTCAAGRQLGRIVSVEEPRQLTGRLAGTVISYLLIPAGPSTTRLLMKIAAELPRPLAPMLAVGDLVMARRQLLNWKRLAERAAGAP